MNLIIKDLIPELTSYNSASEDIGVVTYNGTYSQGSGYSQEPWKIFDKKNDNTNVVCTFISPTFGVPESNTYVEFTFNKQKTIYHIRLEHNGTTGGSTTGIYNMTIQYYDIDSNSYVDLYKTSDYSHMSSQDNYVDIVTQKVITNKIRLLMPESSRILNGTNYYISGQTKEMYIYGR